MKTLFLVLGALVLFLFVFVYLQTKYGTIYDDNGNVIRKPGLPVGTKSVLYGAHCFIIHPFFVATAWIKLYGFTFDPRIWFSFFVHDLGYWGKPNMDGAEGQIHPELGAKIMHIFDLWKIEINKTIYFASEIEMCDYMLKNRVYSAYITPVETGGINVRFFLTLNRGNKWHDFSLYHSRYYAKKNGAQYSKLCVADKLAFCIEPYWLYVIKATLTGEIHEYMNVHHNIPGQTKKEWHEYVVDYMGKWVTEHKEMKPDLWTKTQNTKDWVEDFEFENGNYKNTCLICDHEFMGGKYRRICKECVKWVNIETTSEAMKNATKSLIEFSKAVITATSATKEFTEQTKPLTCEQLGDDLCKHCPMTDYGTVKVNTSNLNLCEGVQCEKAYENYLEEIEQI